MLFNSYEFILFFLPITIIIFFAISRSKRHTLAILWLVITSLFFYGFWSPANIVLIIGSILFNYAIGRTLSQNPKKRILTLGVIANLGLLGYYKYGNFFIDNINSITDTNYYLSPILLPLAISFFTFQQIAYLVDAYRGETYEYSFLNYCIFVTFFPQLIAGPIVHHKEMLPQFSKDETYQLSYKHLAIGLTIFTLGLLKKIILADNVANYAIPVFNAAAQGLTITLFEAWGGTLAYTLQLYFDFSGYSDMAIGLGLIFGIHIPVNFNSPYKAHNIIDFWRRWHITLSRFLKDYLYIALGGNRKGFFRRYLNLMITMALGGLWHGAGWTFVLWGTLHGLYLIVNHIWHAIKKSMGIDKDKSSKFYLFMARLITFTSVAVAWVFFRATSFNAAVDILRGMAGLNGAVLGKGFETVFKPLSTIITFQGIGIGATFKDPKGVIWIIILLFIAWFAPNTQEFMEPALETSDVKATANKRQISQWQPTYLWAIILSFIGLYCIHSTLDKVSEFLYFQF